jgi:Zn-finger in Ran binding protein and others
MVELQNWISTVIAKDFSNHFILSPQIGKDKILANVLFEKLRGDAENEMAEMKRIEEEDAALAATLSNESKQKPGPFLPRNGKAFFRENKCGIYKFMDSKQAVAPSSSSSSDACATSEVHVKSDVEKGMKRGYEREPTVYLDTVKNSIKTFPSKTKPSVPVQQKSKIAANGLLPDGSILQNSFFFRKESSLKDSTDSPSVDRKSPFKKGDEQGGNRGRHDCQDVIELINCCDDDDDNNNTSEQVWALPRPATASSSGTSSTSSLVHNNKDSERDSEVIIIPSGQSSSSSSSKSSHSSSSCGGGGSSCSSSSSSSSSSSGGKKWEATKKVSNSQQNTLQLSQSSHKFVRSSQSTHAAMTHRFEERKRPWEPDPRSGPSGGIKSRELTWRKDCSHAPSLWNCTACTYNNSALSLSCEICGTRKKGGSESSTCHLRS